MLIATLFSRNGLCVNIGAYLKLEVYAGMVFWGQSSLILKKIYFILLRFLRKNSKIT